jgi:predicted phosphodiesterase
LRRIAVLSDVHANLEALEAVLGEAQGLDFYCLGDLVDYGANPNEVISIVKERSTKTVMGNHDQAAVTGDTSLFNAKAAMSSQWTKKQLTPENEAFLRSLPLDMRVSFDGFQAFLAHGSPDDRLWEYVDPRTHSDLFDHYLDKTNVRVIGLGHTHIPYVWKEKGRVVFNPGSVGQPRDGDWRASFAVVTADGTETEVEIRRVEYDAKKAGLKIREAGLPGSHADRLLAGS